MDVIETGIPDVRIVAPRRFGDARGWFSETWNRRAFAQLGLELDFVQDNQSLSGPAGTVRALHFQTPPRAQDKLVRVLRGAIIDVAVDVRRNSPSFGRHVAVELDAAEGRWLLVPKGFAHGFCTLKPDTEVLFKVTDYYSPMNERGIAWDDPDLGIGWPVSPDEAHLAERDKCQPRLADILSPF